MKYEKEFREDNPETIGETDREFDKYNYIEWIDAEYKELKEENTDLNISIRKVTDERDMAIEALGKIYNKSYVFLSNMERFEYRQTLSKLKDNQDGE